MIFLIEFGAPALGLQFRRKVRQDHPDRNTIMENMRHMRRFAPISLVTLIAAGCSETQPVPTAPTPSSQSGPPPAAPVADVILNGLVHETAPTEDRVVAGAAITAVSGERTATAVADERGRFSVALPPGEIRVTVTASRYDATTRTLNTAANTEVSIALPLTFRIIEEAWTLNCCQMMPLTEVTFALPMHYSGALSYSAGVCFGGCSASEFALNCGYIRDVQTGTVFDTGYGYYDNGVGGSIEVQGGHNYELTVYPRCSGTLPAPVPGTSVVAWYVSVRRPI